MDTRRTRPGDSFNRRERTYGEEYELTELAMTHNQPTIAKVIGAELYDPAGSDYGFILYSDAGNEIEDSVSINDSTYTVTNHGAYYYGAPLTYGGFVAP